MGNPPLVICNAKATEHGVTVDIAARHFTPPLVILAGGVLHTPAGSASFSSRRAHHGRMSGSAGTSSPAFVRAEKRIHGSDQQSCSPGAPPVMITDHVPAVGVPSDHATSRVAAAFRARGGVEDGRDLDPASPVRGPAAAAATPPEAELGGPGTAARRAPPASRPAAAPPAPRRAGRVRRGCRHSRTAASATRRPHAPARSQYVRATDGYRAPESSWPS
jgi:hypothetical protein